MTHAPIGTVCNCGERGWLPGVEHAPIRWAMADWNQRTDMEPVVIIDHIMQGYLSTMVDWTVNGGSKVIVHFGIGRSGRIVQMHPIFSPGIHASRRDANASVTAEVVKQRTASPNAYSIGIEHEGASVDPYPSYKVPAEIIYSATNPWPAAMVESSIRVKRWCFETAPSLGKPSRQTIIGHYETGDPNRINDPAAAADRAVWPVERMLAALKARPVALTAQQRELLAYLDSPLGRKLDPSVRAQLRREHGIDDAPEAQETPREPVPAGIDRETARLLVGGIQQAQEMLVAVSERLQQEVERAKRAGIGG